MMTLNKLKALTDRVYYPMHWWIVGKMNGGFYLQIAYLEADVDGRDDTKVEQHGRKWYVSKHSVDSEVFQTMLKAALTSSEHRIREHFLVDDTRVFGPHLSIDKLIEFVRNNEEHKRS